MQPQLQPGEKIDLVGYSLSGNVVRTMAAMYPDLINQGSGSNVVFNATGLGGFSDPAGQNRPRSVVLLEMMDLYRQVEADPNSVTNVPLLLQPLQLTAIAAPPIDRTDPNGMCTPAHVKILPRPMSRTSTRHFITISEPRSQNHHSPNISAWHCRASMLLPWQIREVILFPLASLSKVSR